MLWVSERERGMEVRGRWIECVCVREREREIRGRYG